MSWEQVYQQWLNEENIPENLKNELKDLNTDPEKCEDAFYAPLEFGTAGMRGILGAGINRMNIFTVRQATEGLARFMDTQDPETKRRGVAIAYDSRLVYRFVVKNFRFDHENWLVKCARLRDETNCRSQKNDGCIVEYFSADAR